MEICTTFTQSESFVFLTFALDFDLPKICVQPMNKILKTHNTYIQPHINVINVLIILGKALNTVTWRFKALGKRAAVARLLRVILLFQISRLAFFHFPLPWSNVKDKNVIKALARHCQSIYRWRRRRDRHWAELFASLSFSRRQDFPASPVQIHFQLARRCATDGRLQIADRSWKTPLVCCFVNWMWCGLLCRFLSSV